MCIYHSFLCVTVRGTIAGEVYSYKTFVRKSLVNGFIQPETNNLILDSFSW